MVEVSRLREETHTEAQPYFDVHTDAGETRVSINEAENRVHVYQNDTDIPIATFEYDTGKMIEPIQQE